MYKLIPIIIILLIMPLVSAQPIISSTTGSLVDGSTITVTGSSFGVKSSPQPYIFDDLEDGFDPRWDSTPQVIRDFSRYSNSQKAVYSDFDTIGDISFRPPNSPLSETWYGAHWLYLVPGFSWGSNYYAQCWKDPDGDGNYEPIGVGCDGLTLSNIKLFRLWYPGNPPSGSTNENAYFAFSGWENTFNALTESFPTGAAVNYPYSKQ